MWSTRWHGYSRLVYSGLEETVDLLVRLLHTLVLLVCAIAAFVILVIYLTGATDRSHEKRVRHMHCSDPEAANSVERLLLERSLVETGWKEFLVPNLVHVYRAGKEAALLSAADELCLLAAYHHQRPDQLIVHTDDVEAVHASLVGSQLWSVAGLRDVLRVELYPTPQHVFGILFSEKYRRQQTSDIARLHVLRKHGGIFLENRVFLGSNVDDLRKEELALLVAADSSVDTGIVVAHRDSRLLKAWLSSYSWFLPSNPRHHRGPRTQTLLTSAHPPVARLLTGVSRNYSASSPADLLNVAPSTVILHLSQDASWEEQKLDRETIERILQSL